MVPALIGLASSAHVGAVKTPKNTQETNLATFLIPAPILFIFGEKIFAAFRPAVNSGSAVATSQSMVHGTLKNPRKRTRPPRKGVPFSA